MSNKLECTDCRFCLLEDYGYSNYTTEGTYVHCLLNKHPEGGFDQFYGRDKQCCGVKSGRIKGN